MSNPDDGDATEPQHPSDPTAGMPAAAPPPPPPPPPATPAGYGYAPYGTPPPSVPVRTVERRERTKRARSLTSIAVAFILTIAAAIGYSIGAQHDSTSSNAASSQFPTQQVPSSDSNTGSSSSNGQQANIDVQSIAAKVSPSIVNLVSATSAGEAAGTGIVLTASGLAITNNHVIANSNELQAEIEGSGDYHSVTVLGYSIEDDIALVQIEGVDDLTPATIGDTSTVQVGDAVVALGNAGGKGGDPTVVSGSVTAVDQQITASDQDGSNAETLDNLIQIDANIQPGDSGGALVDADGKVIGVNAAASSANGGFGFGGQSQNEGYAITIEDALAIAKKIQSGDGTDTIHVGAHAGILGVSVSNDGSANGYGDPFGGNGDVGGGASRGSQSGNGAYVQDVQKGSGAADAGIETGATIVAVNGTTVSSAQQLTHTMVKYGPGDKVRVQWVDSSGQSHTATVELGSGPPA